jgi:two-component system sensor histidine kinase DegS
MKRDIATSRARILEIRVQRLGRLLRKRGASLSSARRRSRRDAARIKSRDVQLALAKERYRQLSDRSKTMQEQARHLAHQLLMAQEEERREISRDLHDDVAQILAGITVRLASLGEASALNSQGMRAKIAQTQHLVQHSIEVVHRYARELRPAMLDDLGLIPALRSYIRDLPGRKSLRIRFTCFARVELLNNRARTTLFRVAQEALTNVVRHAGAQRVSVRIYRVPHAVRMEVQDDGKSFPAERLLVAGVSRRLGLLGMRERVAMLNGRFTIHSAPGKGTLVRAEIPFRESHPGPK